MSKKRPKTLNQEHPPHPASKRTDDKGNSYYRLFLKSGTTTMLLCPRVTEGDVRKIEHDFQQISDYIKERVGKCEVSTLRTR